MNRAAAHGVIFGLSAVAWLMAAPAVAQRSQDWQWCAADSTPPDPRIAACTAIVESRGEPPANVAAAYGNRGVAHQRKGDLARAMADFNEAIRLDSRKAFLFQNRSLAFYAKRDTDRAIAGCSEAVRLDPNLAGRCPSKP